ncbi:Morn repeat domain containing protein [Pandoravirus quercus]|uniref:Morn repeat domain containing protein n=2 Tax=Pandoravirus TaxID=2060084 RepID=A0A2U7U9T0_9VIRU|nr:Morn repeat domain containing protein [Pandoravirus quercus]AVK75189.1 Morn repeat domain containing protein [Pandoravirus quercus]QBZ81361.1 morn repeat incomplete domain containing protein [Pandoravirus celtis]
MKRPRGIDESAGPVDMTDGPCPSKRYRRNCREDDRTVETPFFDGLPDELVLAILVALDDPRSLAMWAQTSRRHHNLANDSLIWRHLCESRFGPLLHLNFSERGKSWRWLYRAQAHVAVTKGIDVGATRVNFRGASHVYWGDCRNGLPHGYGLALLLPTPHCNRLRTPARVRTNPAAPEMKNNVGYEGDWVDGHMCGHLINIWANGSRHDGQWRNDRRNGPGLFMRADGFKCDGKWADDMHVGHGTATWPDGTHHVGIWADDLRNGRGVCTYPNGDRYEGEWSNDKSNGRGTYTRPDGCRYEGEWKDGVCHGEGLLVKPSGARYQGDWAEDSRHGHGVHVKADGSRYDGQWRHNERRGTGTWHYADGSSVQGEWHHKNLVSGEVVHHRTGVKACSIDSSCMACTIVAMLQEDTRSTCIVPSGGPVN